MLKLQKNKVDKKNYSYIVIWETLCFWYLRF